MKPLERAKQLSDDHWGYTGKLLELTGVTGCDFALCGYLYKAAATHFYGHAVEDLRNGMFTTPLPAGEGVHISEWYAAESAKAESKESLCPSCQRNAPFKCHGEYLMTKDGGCEGYISALRENMLDAKQEQTKRPRETEGLCSTCQKMRPECGNATIGGVVTYCIRHAKQEAPTAAVLPSTHTAPSTNCKDCGNAACNGMGRNLTCDQGCERFTPKATWTRYDIWQKIEMENARSKEIHGSWHQYTPQEQREAIRNEYFETKEAFKLGDVDGTHGEVAELIQLANLCFRRIQFLKGEADA